MNARRHNLRKPPTTTYTGRVVYPRAPHKFRLRDVARIVRHLEVPQEDQEAFDYATELVAIIVALWGHLLGDVWRRLGLRLIGATVNTIFQVLSMGYSKLSEVGAEMNLVHRVFSFFGIPY